MKLFFLFCLALPRVASATTFGPISLVDQIEHTQYIVEGTVRAASVQIEPSSGLPYTYYGFDMTEQHKGPNLPQQFQIRVPGGEVNGKGYHVAGAPTFTEEEQVILYLKDTNEDMVKEVTGLSSGKFTKKLLGDSTFLMNGLGYPVTGSSGTKIKIVEFQELISRVTHQRATAADRIIMLNEAPVHDDGIADASQPKIVTPIPTVNNEANNAKTVNVPRSSADKNPKGSTVTFWHIGMRLALLASFAVAIILYFRRMKE